jgi:Rod binding domain-containing protein
MVALNPVAQANAAIQQQNSDRNGKLRSAAKQFEGVLMTQLLEVLWKTTPELKKGPGSMYQSMFQGEFAQHLVSGGGIGLSDMIVKALGVEPEPGEASALATRHLQGKLNTLIAPSSPLTASDGKHNGVMVGVARAAKGMVDKSSDHWGKNGSLTPDDYGTLGASEVAGESARRSVENANGYQGYYKCNLFAFEVARRAGLAVPEDARGTLQLSSSNRLTQDASDGSLESGWAKVATGASPAVMQDALHAGEAAFLLVGSGRGDRHGHMAVIEQPHSIDYDEAGQIRSISFEGWEAQPDGAKHLTQRTWNRFGEKGAPGARNNLERIEIIQLGPKSAQPHANTETQGQNP